MSHILSLLAIYAATVTALHALIIGLSMLSGSDNIPGIDAGSIT